MKSQNQQILRKLLAEKLVGVDAVMPNAPMQRKLDLAKHFAKQDLQPELANVRGLETRLNYPLI